MGSPSGRDYTPGMKKARSMLFLAAVALATLLAAGCGNKGDLVRPSETPEAPATN